MRGRLAPLVIVVLTYAGFPASNGHAQQRAQKEECLQKESAMEILFTDSDVGQNWRAVNDGVMGGRSSGGPSFENGAMVFTGNINTNGGGFSSVRADVETGTLAGATGLNLRVKSDGRIYKVTLRTDVTYHRRPISFQAEIPPTPKGEWANVEVSFSTLDASLFGRPLNGARFMAEDVREIGIILADGQDGPFQLDVKWIKSKCAA